jgi:hypothetical protein
MAKASILKRWSKNIGWMMSEENKKRMGRPPIGENTGTRLNLYLTEPREQLFEEAFELLKLKGLLAENSILQRSRTEIVDFALQALIKELKED